MTARALRAARTGARHVSTATASSQTRLDKIIRDTIKATGPMSVSTYMQLCLAHPTEGYYMNPNNPVFGQRGDFITSPEISQVFGELIAIWHLSRWHAAGCPSRVRVVELGPGRGTLAADALRTWAQFPDCAAALHELHLVETSASMRTLQRETLQKYGLLKNKAFGDRELVHWRDSLEDALASSKVDSDTFTMIIAHEFFDALPIHLLEKYKGAWHEIQITSEPDPTASTIIKNPNAPPPLPALRFVRTPEPTSLATLMGNMSPRFAKLTDGVRLEVSPVGFKAARQVAELLNDPKGAGGSALIIDYGQNSMSGNSLRAFKNHKIVDVFEAPGQCDLTANVDFALLKEAIGDSAVSHGAITQHKFLRNMGIEARVARLVQAKKAEGAGDINRNDIAVAARRLFDLTGMGSQYKVLGITGNGARTLAEGESEVWPFVAP
ncbi:hypothetical protein M0805_001736 [Coniferiporia weirii]|nr:hypothetical protein M0805_001736 [Coniferiporia weirii]